jgi:sugar lactone lactonase YvrE
MTMTHSVACLVAATAVTLLASCGQAGVDAEPPASPTRIEFSVADDPFGQLPAGRSWGAASAIYPAPDGASIWVADRCGENSCVDKEDVAPVFQFDLEGRLLRNFGKGTMAFPHGMHVDREGNVWLADASRPDAIGLGHVVLKFSPEGELLMTLGQRGVAGEGPGAFREPNDVLVAPNGDIFVADGHGIGGNNRIVKFTADGRFVGEWGGTGEADGHFQEPHGLAMDSQGRLFVADRGNRRIQIFDQDGNHLESWHQFSRPSGIYIDGDDILYAADSSSNSQTNPGWERGIYIGSARTGEIHGFVPDPEPDPENTPVSGAYGLAVDASGNLYAAEVGPRTVKRYGRR